MHRYNGVYVESHVRIITQLCIIINDLCITVNDGPFSTIEIGSESMECIQTAVLSVSVVGFCMHDMQDIVRRLKGVFQNLVLEDSDL